MWRSGESRRTQRAVLAEMIETARRSDSYEAPWRLVPQIWHHYRDEAAILRDLQQQWRTALAGAVYVAIESGAGDLRHDVQTAFEQVNRRHHGLRKVLETHADHPAIARAMHKERALLASAAGLFAVPDAPAAPVVSGPAVEAAEPAAPAADLGPGASNVVPLRPGPAPRSRPCPARPPDCPTA